MNYDQSHNYDKKARERLDALIGWLSGRLPGCNVPLLIENSLGAAYAPRRKDLWGAQLIANYLTRKALKGDQAFASADLHIEVSDAIQAETCIAIVSSGEAVLSDLEHVAHPEISGSTLAPLNNLAELDNCIQITRASIKLISSDARSSALVANHCGAICFIAASPALQPGQCVSLSSRSTPGIIYLSAAPIILTAESIVHESAHQMLYAVAEADDLFAEDDLKISTPLRSDPRPLIGLLHQICVLFHLVAFYRSLLNGPTVDVVERNQAKIQKRLQRHCEDHASGCTSLEQHINKLTSRGREVYAELRAI